MTSCNLRDMYQRLVPSCAIPDEMVCHTCGMFREVTPEVNAWVAANRPDLMARYGTCGQLGFGVLTCHCAEAAREEAAQGTARDRERIFQANLPRRGDATGPRTFSNFSLNDSNQAMYAAVHEWADGQGAPLLVVTGTYGCGKTHLAEAAIRYRLDQGDWARYDTPESTLNRLRDSFDHDKSEESHEDLIALYRAVKWLALDDLGQQPASEWGRGQVMMLIDQRYMDGSRTLITTNHGSSRELARAWDARLASRLFDTHSSTVRVIWTTAVDYRIHGTDDRKARK